MIIYRNSTQVLDVPITANAVHKATLMKEDYIKIPFEDTVNHVFKAGDYVTYGGRNYYLNKDYIPTMKNEATFAYELQFNAPWYNLGTYMFFYNTYVNGQVTKRESDWQITDTAANIINLIIRNTQDQSRDCPCRLSSTFYCEGTPVKSFTFSNTSVLGALNNLAKDFELEWWVEVHNSVFYLHFGECDDSIVMENGAVVFNADGSRKKGSASEFLISGSNVSAPSVSNKNDIKKQYYVYGSSRNIDQTVDLISQADGSYITSMVTKRLALDGNPQSSANRAFMQNKGYGEEVVIFDDIYPRSDWQVTNVTPISIQSEEVEGYDAQGNPIYKTYTVYNVRLGVAEKQQGEWVVTDPNKFSDEVFEIIADPTKDVQCIEDMVASGKPLSLKFIVKDQNNETITPVLAGFEFELGAILYTNSEGTFPNKSSSYQWYEFQIIKQEINGYVIPNTTLIPHVGDWVCLYNLKGEYIKTSDNENAQAELLDAFKKYYMNLKKDVSYTVKPYVNTSLNMEIGTSVLLIYSSNTIRSRISSYEKKLDYNIDASYTISSYMQPSTVNQLKEEVKVITANIANGSAFQLDGEAAMSILTTYGKNLFLSKTQEDTASGKINFLRGIDSKALATLASVVVGSTIGTSTFVDGFVGSGWRVDASGNLTVNNLTVRQTMRVFELLIQQVRATGGSIYASAACGKIKQVNASGDNLGLILENGNGVGNMFQVGDYIRCQRWDYTRVKIKNYWLRVNSTLGNLIVVNVSGLSSSDYPEAGDDIVLFGSEDVNRQSAITITATDDGKPKITILNGINASVVSSGDLSGCTKVVLGDLSGVSDSDFGGQLSGYGLYSDNVYLKGKLAFSDGTLISNEITKIKSGEIVLDAEKTIVKNNFEVNQLETTPTSGNAKIAIKGSLLEVYGLESTEYPNIRFGVDENTGYAIMQYFDKRGNLMYDLGPNGITMRFDISPATFDEYIYVMASSSSDEGWHQTGSGATGFKLYLFKAKRYNNRIASDDVYALDLDIAEAADGKYFSSNSQITASGSSLNNLANKSKCHLKGQSVRSMNDEFPVWEIEDIDIDLEYVESFIRQTLGLPSTYDFSQHGINTMFIKQRVGTGVKPQLVYDINFQLCFTFSNGNRYSTFDFWQVT